MNTLKDRLQEKQKALFDLQKEIIEIRRSMPLEEVSDYELLDKYGHPVTLSSLFGDSDELLLIHNMGKECKYCTMWADGLRGFTEVIEDRMPWVLASPNDPETLREFSESRHWHFKVVSFQGTSLGRDLGFELAEDGKSSYLPGVSALVRKDGKIYRSGYDSFGPGDMYNSVWHFFDLFPNGANGWAPKYVYTSNNPSINLLD
ncbi:MAG: DUF899 family protein [Saprospiraceae bacterium]|nr:DUF899 family protein [Saprospiraceae bacterium]